MWIAVDLNGTQALPSGARHLALLSELGHSNFLSFFHEHSISLNKSSWDIVPNISFCSSWMKISLRVWKDILVFGLNRVLTAALTHIPFKLEALWCSHCMPFCLQAVLLMTFHSWNTDFVITWDMKHFSKSGVHSCLLCSVTSSNK